MSTPPTPGILKIPSRIGLILSWQLLTLFFCLPAIAEPSEKIFKVGIIAPLTLGNADAGKDITRTFELFFKQIPKDSKYKYQLIFEDGACGVGASATTAAKKFLDLDKVNFLITSCSGETLQVAPLAKRAKVPLITVYSSHKDIKTMGDFIFRTFIDIERGIGILSQTITKQSDNVALISENNPFTLGIKELLEKELKDHLIFSQDFEPEAGDMRALLLKASSKNPKAYYFNCASPKTLSNIVNQARQLGIKEPIYSYLYPAEKSFLDITGNNSEGIMFLALPDVTSANIEFHGFINSFKNTYQASPSYNFLVAASFNAARSIFDAAEAVGTNGEALTDFLDTYHGQGATGSIEYDKNGDIKNLNFVMKQISGGTAVNLSK